MGESTNACATLRFDRRIRLEFRGATITSDAGLLACRELDDALGLTETASECLQESRGGRNVQHRLVGLLRRRCIVVWRATRMPTTLNGWPTIRRCGSRAELDSAVVPSVRGQPGASISVRSGVQPWELPSPAVSAQGGQALVAAERAGQADQDGRPSGAALPMRLIFQLSEVSVPRRLFQGVLDRIGRLSPASS